MLQSANWVWPSMLPRPPLGSTKLEQLVEVPSFGDRTEENNSLSPNSPYHFPILVRRFKGAGLVDRLFQCGA